MSLPTGYSNASTGGGGGSGGNSGAANLSTTAATTINNSAADRLQHSNSQNSINTLTTNPATMNNPQAHNYMRGGPQPNTRHRTTTTVTRGNPKDMNGDTILILSLINRLGAKLPSNTRRRLEAVESDPMVQLTIRSLVDLSQYRLTTAAHSLMTLLENVNKSISIINDDGPSIDILQSQLLILKVLGACMSHHWRCHRDTQRERNRATNNGCDNNPMSPHSASSAQSFRKRSESDVTMHPTSMPKSESSSSINNFDTISHGSHTHSTRSYTMAGTEAPVGLDAFESTRVATSRQSLEAIAAQAHSTYEDPPALEEPLAKYIFHVVASFLQNTSPDVYDAHAAAGGAALAAAMVDSPDVYGKSTHHPASLSSAGVGGGVTSPTATSHGAAGTGRDFLTSTYAALADAPADLAYEIHRAAGRVLFYVSASNWPVVFARLKARIAVLAQTSDENADTGEVRLLEWCNLNSRRLSMVLQELGTVFLQMKRSAQQVTAVVLRRSIWNWIEVYPMDFAQLCRSQKRLEGGPEILFDQCNSVADSHRRKMVFWPLQAMLLVLCPDILLNIVESDLIKTTKKTLFLDSLKKSLKSNKSAEVAAIACVDLCKAATYTNREEQLALSTIVTDIENELRDKLFDPQRPFLTMSGAIDQRLMTECLTALFRSSPHSTLESLIPICLNDNTHTVFRLVLVKSCYLIASEKQLAWNPTISSMYSVLATPLRLLLLQSNMSHGQEGAMSSAPRGATNNRGPFERRFGRRAQVAALLAEEASERHEIVLNILKLYRTDPQLAVFNQNPHTQYEENCNLITAITSWLHDPDPLIRTNAAEALLELHKPAFINQWGPPHLIMKSFWSISSQVMLAVARHILNFKEREDGTRYALELLQQLLVRRNEFLREHQEHCTVGMEIPDRLNASVALEIVLLVLLCSAETEICSNAVACFNHLVTEAYYTEEAEDPQHAQLTIVENLRVYMELASSGGLVTGRVAQQKRIRKMLRMMDRQTPGNQAAWEEAYKRWRMLMQAVARPIDEPVIEEPTRRKGIFQDKLAVGTSGNSTNMARSIVGNQPMGDFLEDRGEWHNYTGFLCALGGCCLNDTNITNSASSRRSNDPNQMISRFIHEMVELLVCENVVVREVVQQTLGADLSPALYGILFTQLEHEVDRFLTTDNETYCSDRNTLFVEQAISVIKLILERMETTNQSLLAVDLGKLILSFAQYLNRINMNAVVLRIKIKMCQLCEILMAKKDFLSLRQEIKFRNQVLEFTIEWTSDFTSKTDSGQPSVEDQVAFHRTEKLQRDLDQACMKSIVSLLAQLPLQPSDMEHEADVSQIKSRLFYKYFSFFLKVLNRCRVLETIDAGAHTTKNSHDLQVLLQQSREAVRDLAPLKDYTILALSNLLSANIESGLKYSLSMGYHDDPKTRTAFMQVLTNILYQGAEFEGLAENVKNDRYDKLVELLTDSELCIALSLCEVCPVADIETVGQLLLTAVETRGETIRLLQYVIERELARTETAAEVFRRNCMATKLMAFYARMYGSEYLRVTLQPLIQELVDNSQRWTLELDPSKLPPGTDTKRNLVNLREMSQRFLDVIVTSTDKMPRQLREICHFLSSVVNERFPKAKLTAVGGFIFLRFFCPAIVSPETHNLAQPVRNKEVRRGLLLITKVIQNLANQVLFGTKETFMTSLNDFLDKNMGVVKKFLKDISEPVNSMNSSPAVIELGRVNTATSALSPTSATSSSSTSRLSEADLIQLHKALYDNQERISREVAARRSGPRSLMVRADGSTIDQETYQTAAKRAYEKLSTVLAQLGPPPDVPQLEPVMPSGTRYGAANELFREFMQRNAHRNVDSIRSKRIFYEGGVSKDKNPVFYFIARRLIIEMTDMELFIYFVLHSLEPKLGKPFEIVIDLTHFGQQNEVQEQWITQFLQVLPFNAEQNLSSVYLYNVCTKFKKFSKRLPRSVSSRLSKKGVFISTMNELYEHIISSEVRLPKATVSLDVEPAKVFSPVTKIAHYKLPMPTVMKITQDHVQVTSLRKQEILGVSAIFNDVYRISDIDDVLLMVHRSDDSAVVIKYDRGNASLTFCSSKAEAIFQELIKPTNISERVIRPSDVPGTLLNMALLNLGSGDANLRSASYNLLYSLCVTFNFSTESQLLSVKGMCIPANSGSFVKAISEKLASTEPHLTLEFLSECFVGLNKSSKPLKSFCLEYMTPWLANLDRFIHVGNDDSQRGLTKVNELLHQLIDLTVKKRKCRMDDMIPLILDAFVPYAVERGFSSQQAEVMANTTVTLLHIVYAVIANTSLKPKRSLTEHESWNEIAVLIRFLLMMSFDNRLHVLQYLPELFHIVSLVAATGPGMIRASVHGIIINIVQSLCTSLQLDSDNLRTVKFLLSELSEPKSLLLFGLNRTSGNAFMRSMEATTDTREAMPLTSLETIVRMLLDVMISGAPNTEYANAWRARWMSLVASTAFQFNPAIQPRAFVVLGCLAHAAVDDDLLYQILVALKGALSLFEEGDCNLIVSIVMCLTSIAENLDGSSKYLQQLFWLAIALIQIGHVPLFPSALNLMEVVLQTLEDNGFFHEELPADFLLRARESLFEDIGYENSNDDNTLSSGVEKRPHVNDMFTTNFPFAGLKHSQTITATTDALTTFLEISAQEPSKTVDPNLLGYLAPLLPGAARNSALKDLFWISAVESDFENTEGEQTYHCLFDKLAIPDQTTAMLLVALMITMLNSAEYEAEQLFLYGFLAEAATAMPQVFAMFYDSLLPKMNQMLCNSQVVPIIESIQSILFTMVSSPYLKGQRAQRAPLDELGFGGLAESGSFQHVTRAQKKTAADLASRTVERMVT
ncbi:hypothetical protein BDF19DRAFT_434347 [Syncephalis fuscata]|nr:hypothetical protein BDF19DRAFT_434347 [Syncephalis fuscata]